MSTKLRLTMFSLGMVALAPLAAHGAPPEGVPPADVPAIEVAPVHGVTIGPGRKLWVFVFPERGKGKGPPPKEDSPSACDDLDQSNYAPLGFYLRGPVTFNIKDGSIPINTTAADTAIRDSFFAWESAVGIPREDLFKIISTGGAVGPAADEKNTVGWVRIVPRNVLAAAWIWTETGPDGVEYVTDADIFYNLFQKWGVFSTCNGQDRFEVQNIGTHEVGHVIGLAHFKDTAAMATMYPSAAKGEVKKQTLTLGDKDGAFDLTSHITTP